MQINQVIFTGVPGSNSHLSTLNISKTEYLPKVLSNHFSFYFEGTRVRATKNGYFQIFCSRENLKHLNSTEKLKTFFENIISLTYVLFKNVQLEYINFKVSNIQVSGELNVSDESLFKSIIDKFSSISKVEVGERENRSVLFFPIESDSEFLDLWPMRATSGDFTIRFYKKGSYSGVILNVDYLDILNIILQSLND